MERWKRRRRQQRRITFFPRPSRVTCKKQSPLELQRYSTTGRPEGAHEHDEVHSVVIISAGRIAKPDMLTLREKSRTTGLTRRQGEINCETGSDAMRDATILSRRHCSTHASATSPPVRLRQECPQTRKARPRPRAGRAAGSARASTGWIVSALSSTLRRASLGHSCRNGSHLWTSATQRRVQIIRDGDGWRNPTRVGSRLCIATDVIGSERSGR